eukprot:m.9755 g.9755  ORF g.9755 m.9755 type:complete len:190 (-) comp5033_c0_seq1:288-857(-)
MASPHIEVTKFADAEAKIQAALKDEAKLKSLWHRIDNNNSGKVSLAEIGKFTRETYPSLDHAPALMRAYKLTTLKDGDGDSWVEPNEFPALLRNILYFNKVFAVFEDIDTGDDRRIDLGEFKKGTKKLGMKLSDADAAAAFKQIDKNGGGQVLFEEFCEWLAEQHCPVGGTVVSSFTTSADRANDEHRK